MTEMTDEELSRAVALACDWKPAPCSALPETCDSVHWWRDSTGVLRLVSEMRFTTSLDACFGPGGPVEYAKAKGWELILGLYGEEWECSFYGKRDDGDEHGIGEKADKSSSRALCLAFLAAIEATK